MMNQDYIIGDTNERNVLDSSKGKKIKTGKIINHLI